MICERGAGENFAFWRKCHNNEMQRDSSGFYMWFFSKVNDLFTILLAQRCLFAAFFLLEVVY